MRGWWCDHSRGGSPSRKACLGGGPWRRAATRACFVTLAASSIINTRTQPRKRTCHSNPHNTRISHCPHDTLHTILAVVRACAVLLQLSLAAGQYGSQSSCTYDEDPNHVERKFREFRVPGTGIE